jgi:hypothetical protein
MISEAWEDRALNAATTFADECAELQRSNPYDAIVPLDNVINTLMTELWDRGSVRRKSGSPLSRQ